MYVATSAPLHPSAQRLMYVPQSALIIATTPILVAIFRTAKTKIIETATLAATTPYP